MDDNSKRIAKNTIILYFRLFLTSIIGLYSSRLILEKLGVVDFGIYNVVGGIVLLLSTLNDTMSIASFRFMSIELGRNNINRLTSIFSSSLIVHIIIAVGVVILCETLGLWLFCNKLVIPDEKYIPAMWAYQFSILTGVFMIISTPYTNCILAHEKMDAYAVFSMLDAIMKLLILFLIGFSSYNRLIEYAFLFCISQILLRLLYGFYCKRNFFEVNLNLKLNLDDIKSLLGFTSWNFFTILATIGYAQGINILLNIFFGPSVNAARAITEQIRTKIQLFARNIQDAINPQIIKSYGADNLDYTYKLIINSSRFSFFLLYLLILPLSLKMDIILKWWLKDVPEFTSIFSQLILIFILISALQNPLITAINATGRIKWYNIYESCVLILILPTSYLLLLHGYSSYSVFVVQIIFGIIALIVSLVYVHKLLQLKLSNYIYNVWAKNIIIILLTYPLSWFIVKMLDDTFVDFVISCFVSVGIYIVVLCRFGLTKNEKEEFLKILRKKINL